MEFRSINDVHQFLENIPAFKKEGATAGNFTLHRFKEYCAAVGNPQHQFASVHVAGSNGKGSTCRILGAVYGQSGYKTGVYTSPHLLKYHERFSVNGTTITDDELLLFFQKFGAQIKHFKLTYFEISTAIAFWWFATCGVDVAIIEVGLGGRLDATNVIMPRASVITTVALDHTDILGDTIAAIAREKAGIIKPGVPVIMGCMPAEAKAEIRKTANQKNSALLEINEPDFSFDEATCTIIIQDKTLEPAPSLQHSVQAYNIAAAYLVCTILNDQFPVNKKQFAAGLKNVDRIYPAMGRFEKLHPHLRWYFDGGHNLQAVKALKEQTRKKGPVSEAVLVFALMSDKINKKMMSEFSEFKKIVYHTLPLGRAAGIDEIRNRLPTVTSFPEQNDARITLLKELQAELVIFAGSYYFYPTVRDWLSSMKIDR